LHERGKKPLIVRLAWTPVQPAELHGNARIDTIEEA
jgi:hypothetical protein